jgi:hypothetical protein
MSSTGLILWNLYASLVERVRVRDDIYGSVKRDISKQSSVY